MKRYKNKQGTSGVVAFEAGQDFIKVKFRGGDTYLYNYSKPGGHHVEEMKLLAEEGRGLSTYISTFVRENYASKLS